MTRCKHFDEMVGVCGHQIPHEHHVISKEDLIPLGFILFGICWLMMKAFETPPDVPPAEKPWPFGD